MNPTPRLKKPDFTALRAKRDKALDEAFDKIAAEFFPGTPKSELLRFDHPQACYCACPDGPCEHQWGGWQEFDDGRGGEQICKLCGFGAMAHSMRCGP